MMPTQARSFNLLILAFCYLAILLSTRAVPDTSSVSHPTFSVGTTLSTYREHLNAVSAVAWSPDGKNIASASYDKTVQVWESMTGTPILTYRNHSSEVLAVAWSPDGTRIASGDDDGIVYVWQAPLACQYCQYVSGEQVQHVREVSL